MCGKDYEKHGHEVPNLVWSRRDEIHHMSASGMSAESIAEVMGCTVSTVRKWLAYPEPPKGTNE